MFDEPATSILRVRDVADHLYGFLVAGNVPELSMQHVSKDDKRTCKEAAYPITSQNEELVFLGELGLSGVGRADNKLFHRRISKGTGDSQNTFGARVSDVHRQ